jgi:hypothetical protein
MKATAAISIAALVAALAATPSLALDLNVGGGANAAATVASDSNSTSADAGVGVDLKASAKGKGVNSGDLGVDATTTGAINASASDDALDIDTRLDLLVKLINDADYDETSFNTWADASATAVIKTNDLFDADGQAKIDAALQANLDEQDDLRAAIDANANLKAWLDSNGIDASSVIAIDVSADGSVDVYEG